MSQKLLFIFNPHAGKGQIKNHLVDIVDMMVKAGFDVTIYTTQAQADATRKVVEEGAGYDRIVCSGGDGTLDEVMTGLMQAKLHIPIGYIPAGSTNDFANSLGIPREMLKAAERAVGQTDFHAISEISIRIPLSMWQRLVCLQRFPIRHPSS